MILHLPSTLPMFWFVLMFAYATTHPVIVDPLYSFDFPACNIEPTFTDDKKPTLGFDLEPPYSAEFPNCQMKQSITDDKNASLGYDQDPPYSAEFPKCQNVSKVPVQTTQRPVPQPTMATDPPTKAPTTSDKNEWSSPSKTESSTEPSVLPTETTDSTTGKDQLEDDGTKDGVVKRTTTGIKNEESTEEPRTSETTQGQKERTSAEMEKLTSPAIGNWSSTPRSTFKNAVFNTTAPRLPETSQTPHVTDPQTSSKLPTTPTKTTRVTPAHAKESTPKSTVPFLPNSTSQIPTTGPTKSTASDEFEKTSKPAKSTDGPTTEIGHGSTGKTEGQTTSQIRGNTTSVGKETDSAAEDRITDRPSVNTAKPETSEKMPETPMPNTIPNEKPTIVTSPLPMKSTSTAPTPIAHPETFSSVITEATPTSKIGKEETQKEPTTTTGTKGSTTTNGPSTAKTTTTPVPAIENKGTSTTSGITKTTKTTPTKALTTLTTQKQDPTSTTGIHQTSTPTITTQKTETPIETTPSPSVTPIQKPTLSTSTEVPTTTAIPFTTEAIDCSLTCPNGTFEGKDQCYYHFTEFVHTRRLGNALTFCRHLGENWNLAADRDMMEDYQLIKEWKKTVNLTSTYFHSFRPTFTVVNGTSFTELVDIANMTRILLKADKRTEGLNAFCKTGKKCGPLSCRIDDLYDVHLKVLPPQKQLPYQKFQYPEEKSLRCNYPSTTILNFTCQQNGLIYPKPRDLSCELPAWWIPQIPLPGNGPIRASCKECHHRGTAACQKVPGGVRCICNAYFHRCTCDMSINQCLLKGNPCQNGGDCIHMVDHRLCSCKVPFVGTRCEKDASKITWNGEGKSISYVSTASVMSLLLFVAMAYAHLYRIFKGDDSETWIDRFNPQKNFVGLRNYVLIATSFWLVCFARPAIFLSNRLDYRLWTFLIYSGFFLAQALHALEAQNVCYLVKGISAEKWETDAGGVKRWWLTVHFRLLLPVFALFIVTSFVAFQYWNDVSIKPTHLNMRLTIVATISYIVHFVQCGVINDDVLESWMRTYVYWLPNLPWPELSPMQRLNKEELISLWTGKKPEGSYFHPSIEDYLSEDTRTHFFRELTSFYLSRRMLGISWEKAREETLKRDPELYEGPHSEARQLRVLADEWIRQITIWDRYVLKVDRRPVTTQQQVAEKVMNRPHLGRSQVMEEDRIVAKMGEMREMLGYRKTAGTDSVELLAESETYGKGYVEWQKFRAASPPVRLRSQLPALRKRFQEMKPKIQKHLEEKPDSAFSLWYKANDYRPDYDGVCNFMQKDPNPYKLPGAADFVEIAFYDSLTNGMEWEKARKWNAKQKEVERFHNLEPEVQEAKIAERDRLAKINAERRAQWEKDPWFEEDKWVAEPWELLYKQQNVNAHWRAPRPPPFEPYEPGVYEPEGTPQFDANGVRALRMDRPSEVRKRQRRAQQQALTGFTLDFHE